jgi:predicted kinase
VLKAWVRARVALLRAVQHERAAARGARAEAAALARLAARLAWGVRGISVVAVGGTAATGKSTLAAALRAETRFAVLAADRERKARVGLAATARGGPELYTPAVDRAVYAALGARVAALRTRGRGAIVDATLRRERDRAAFVAAAGAEPDLWVECRAPEEVVLARAADREGAAGRVSDAGAEQAARQLAAPCALTEAAPDRWCAARTDRPAAEVVAELGALADARLAASALDAGRDDGHRHVAALADRV